MGSAECPECGSTDFRVTESRISRKGTFKRRRRKCHTCGFAFTSYEITQSSYEAAQRNAKFISELHGYLSMKSNEYGESNRVVGLTCDSCKYMRMRGCDFKFPEAGGTFAQSCLYSDDLS